MDVVFAWIRARPWPRSVSYIVLTALGVVLSNAQNWLSGGRIELTTFPRRTSLFLAPLRGMHARLVRMKVDLQEASEDRIKALLATLHADIDAMNLARADGLQKSLTSLLQERDILARLPTWPWSTGTLRGFLSALLLPIVLFLIQRFLGQIV
jgi:hypothetical protein